MRVLLQRSLESSVVVDNKVVGKIDKGYVIFVGFTHTDNENVIDKMINKIINLRVFTDSKDLMNLSLLDEKGKILSISQFTLYADPYNGRRPSFTDAMKPKEAQDLYDNFNKKLSELNIEVSTGIFGADMKVNIINDGPVTIFLDSKYL